MKKTLTKRTGVLLLALVMLTSCFVGGTFAKYVTSLNMGGSNDDTNGDGSAARVAKWGVKITGVQVDSTSGKGKLVLFDDQYATDDTKTYTGTYSVDSADGALVVAPGTGSVDENGKPKTGALSIQLSGTPEVASKIEVKASVTLGGEWKVNGEFYCPLIFYVGGEAVDTSNCKSVEEINAALTSAAVSVICDPNQNLANVTVGEGEDAETLSVNIGWRWPFHVSDAQDAKDTALGNAAAQAASAEGGTALSVSVSGTVSVTQVD